MTCYSDFKSEFDNNTDERLLQLASESPKLDSKQNENQTELRAFKRVNVLFDE